MNEQLPIKFFWPLTEQMELDLEYGPTHLHYRAKGIAGTSSMPIKGSIYEYKSTGATFQPKTMGNPTSITSLSFISDFRAAFPKRFLRWY